jgi:pseudouridine 5'-phosphatase
VPLSLAEWKARVGEQRERFRKSEPLPGAQELLHNLSHRTVPPVRMALASSAGKSLFEIKMSRLRSMSDAVPEQCRVFGDDADMATKQKKPAPDIFLLALQRINCTLEGQGVKEAIRPEECLVFEDSIAGVEAARRARMRVIWVPHPGLLSVCEGWMDEVLQGTAEGDGENIGPMLPKGGSHSVRTQDSGGYVWKTEDGWAECIESLLHFRYDHYGIHLES